eukprot:3940570-Rhodomonas_salina.1
MNGGAELDLEPQTPEERKVRGEREERRRIEGGGKGGNTIRLRACYAMSGTDLCPVLTEATTAAICLRPCCVLSSAIGLRVGLRTCKVLSRRIGGYGATRRQRERSGRRRRKRTRLRCPIRLRPRYPLSAYAPDTRYPPMRLLCAIRLAPDTCYPPTHLRCDVRELEYDARRCAVLSQCMLLPGTAGRHSGYAQGCPPGTAP